MNPHDTRILEALNTRSALPTAAVTSTVNAAQRDVRYSNDRVRYRLKSLERRGYVRHSTGPGFTPSLSWSLTEAGKFALECGEPSEAAPLRQYEVVINLQVGEISTLHYARTRDSAIYQAFLDYREAMPATTFLAFRKRVTAQIAPVWPTDCYSYVKQHYGLDVDAGDRIQACGRSGIVVPHTAYHHVHFVPSGQKYSVPVHPSDVTVLERRAGA